jgi:4-amino-4-deoxy-L-arabinose transferase-like glycosyltransferase
MKTRTTLILLAIAIGLLAGGLRFYRLGAWPFFGDELATFHEEDSFTNPDAGETQTDRLPRMIPLSYIVHRAGYSLFGRDEFGSRAILAVLGTAQVMLVFLLLSGLVNRPQALATALLLAVWPEHIYQSQTHRFYMIAAFFAALCMLAGAWAVQRKSVAWTIIACVLAVATILTHTLQGVILVGLFAGLVVAACVRRQPLPWFQLKYVAATGVIVLGMVAFYLYPLARGWNGREGWGSSPLHQLMASVYEIGWPVALLAGLGAVSAVKFADEQGCYWLTWAVLWVVASIVLPCVIVFHSAYVFPLALGVIVLAGCAAGQIYAYLRQQSWLLGGAWIAVVCAFNLPSLLSHYSDGSRHDYRTPARFISKNWQAGDHVAAVAPGALRRYADVCQDAVSLQTWDPLPDLKKLSGQPGRTWIVIPSNRPGKSEDLRRWLGANCTQEMELKPPRYDYREHVVEVYLYTAGGNNAVAAAGRED